MHIKYRTLEELRAANALRQRIWRAKRRAAALAAKRKVKRGFKNRIESKRRAGLEVAIK